jgi:DNA-binding IclR family transcriptional regulator
VAWADPRIVTRWLADVPTARHPQYREALAATRRRGYAVELSAPPAGQLLEVLARWDGVADASVAAVRDLLDELAAELVDQGEYLAGELEPDRTYNVTVVNAPVLGDDGRPVLVLALTGFGPLTGARIQEVGRRLVAATSELTAAVARPRTNGSSGVR